MIYINTSKCTVPFNRAIRVAPCASRHGEISEWGLFMDGVWEPIETFIDEHDAQQARAWIWMQVQGCKMFIDLQQIKG